MKTLHLSIIVILFSSIFGFGAAYAEQPLLKFYNTSDRVLVGKIISLSQVHTMTGDTTQYPNQTRYAVQVEAYYKDPQDFKLVTVYGYAKGIYFSQDPTYDVGDRVFLYLVKKNGFYQTQFPSFKLDNNCDARPMVPMSVLPFEGPEIAGPAGGSPFDFVGSDGSKRLTYMLGEKIHINFVATNYLPMVKYATLNFLIKTDNDTKLVFNDTKQIMLPACDGNVPVSWDFVPENRGSYSVYANMSSSISIGGTGFLFTEPRVADGFLVKDNPSGVKIDTSPYLILSPLKQFKSGTIPRDVTCWQGFQLIFKAEDGSPACVTSDTSSILVQRGWTHNNIILQKNLPHVIIPLLNDTNSGKPEATNENKTSPTLQLFLSVDSGYENPAWPVSIDIALNNTGSVPLTLEKSDNWPRNDLTSGMCSNLPFGISILKGYYTEQNMSSARSLVIYQLVPCPMPTLIKSYTFQPLSSMATQECDSLFSCPGLTDMKAHLVIPDFMDNGQHHSFNVGPYTIVGGDEWGHVTIQHFTEEYATAYSNQIGK
ncbi:MAG: hypothetical protein ACYC6W_11270 [Nitrosotalea sp.]